MPIKMWPRTHDTLEEHLISNKDMAEHGRRRPELVLISSPLQGHMTPMLQLASYLHSKGFSITIANFDFNKLDPSKHPDFFFLPLPDNLSGSDISSGFIQFLQTVSDNCKPHLEKYLIQMINTQKESSEKESVVIIYDNLMFFAGDIAGDLGLPSIILRSSSAAFFPIYWIIPQLHQEDRFPVKDSLLQEIIPEFHPFRYRDLPYSDQSIQETLQLIAMNTPKTPPSAFIWNTLDFLEQSVLTQIRHHYQVPIFTIGPLHKTSPTPSTSFLEEDTSCIPWLDKQSPKSVIYVSLGSLASIDVKVATEMAWGFANSNQPFIWVVRPGSVHGCDWIEFLPEDLASEMKERGLIVKWAPQKEVLAHSSVGGFWSHCGWNSTLESVSVGVPMLCQPFSIDQMLNARYLSYVWKMGLEIDVERGEIESAIRRVLVSKEGEDMRSRATEIEEQVRVAVRNGGSSRNSMNDMVKFILSL